MMKNTEFHIIFTVILVLFLPFTTASAESIEPKRTIETHGKAEIKVKPDVAFVTINIETNEKTAKEAKDTNATIVQNVRDTLLTKKLGLNKKDIETKSFNLNPRIVWNERKRKNEMAGFQATHLLKIRIFNLDLVGKILDTSVNAGANGVSSIIFTLQEKEKKKAKVKALQFASENAKEKAKILTKSLGVNLDKVLSIIEGNGSFTPFRQSRGYETKSLMMEASPATEITHGEVNISASVSIVFELH